MSDKKYQILKYHNDINKLKLGIFTEKETNIFFTLLLKARDAQIDENIINISFSELKELSNGDKNNSRFIKSILSLNSKLKSLNQTIETKPGVFNTFSLFGDITTDTNKETIEIPIDDKFKYLVHNFMGNFTIIDFKLLVSLKGNYLKTLYRLLKQWDTKQERTFEIENFREILEIPKSYKMYNIDQKILKPALKELSKYFENLKIEKIKKGVKIVSIKFKWKNKKRNLQNTLEITISERLNKTIEKAKRNRYLVKLLNVNNIEKLLQMFDEDLIIKGLNKAYKEINKEIKSINYLVKTIETVAKEQSKVLVVEPEIVNKSSLDKDIIEAEIVEDKPKEEEVAKPKIKKVKVTEEEYKKLYEMHLEKYNTKHSIYAEKSFRIRYDITEKPRITKKLKSLIEEFEISENEVLKEILNGSSREEAVNKISESKEKSSQKTIDSEYEEFLRWKREREKLKEKK